MGDGETVTVGGKVKFLIQNITDIFNKCNQFVLVGNINSTTVNLAIVGVKGNKFTIIFEVIYESQKIDTLVDPLKETLQVALGVGITPQLCCISCAGSVENNVCTLPNLKWKINGNEIENIIHMETLVIHDFLAITYGVPFLNVNDPNQITKLPQSGDPKKDANMVVFGPDISLKGYLAGVYYPCLSEDQSAYASFVYETERARNLLFKTNDIVSGKNISDITINSFHQNEPYQKVFIETYSNFVNKIASLFSAFGGFYIVDEIVVQNKLLFLQSGLFTKNMENIPVYIVNNCCFPSLYYYGTTNANRLLNPNYFST